LVSFFPLLSFWFIRSTKGVEVFGRDEDTKPEIVALKMNKLYAFNPFLLDGDKPGSTFTPFAVARRDRHVFTC
jgi:hypothetical protein